MKNWHHLVAPTHSIKSWTLHVLTKNITVSWKFWHGSATITRSLHQKSLDAGFIDENNTVNCDNAEKIGARIQKSSDNELFTSCLFKRKDQITNLQNLHSSIMTDKERIAIDLLTLFLRLVVLVDRKPEVEIENCFYHDLTPYPTALFKNDEMRTTNNKSSLKHFLLEWVKISENTDNEIIADEGALLQSCNWTNKNVQQNIGNVHRCRKFNINTIEKC